MLYFAVHPVVSLYLMSCSTQRCLSLAMIWIIIININIILCELCQLQWQQHYVTLHSTVYGVADRRRIKRWLFILNVIKSTFSPLGNSIFFLALNTQVISIGEDIIYIFKSLCSTLLKELHSLTIVQGENTK